MENKASEREAVVTKAKEIKRAVPGTQVEVGNSIYTVAPCGALVRLTPKLEPGIPPSHEHNNSRRRRRQKGKF